MRLKLNYIYLILLISFCYSCKSKQEIKPEDKVIASVYDKKLYLSELKEMLPEGLNKADSTHYVTAYAERWVRQTLLMHEADQNISNNPSIDELVRDYRASLVRHLYEKNLVESLLDTIVPAAEIDKYYEEHKNEFKLQSSIVKCNLLKVASNIPNIKDVQSLWENRTDNEAAMEQLKEFCNKNNALFLLDDETWYRANEISSILPTPLFSFNDLVTVGATITRSDKNYTYYLKIAKTVRSNENAPLDFVYDQIRKLIINDRKMKFIDEKIEEMYDLEINRNNIKFYTK